MQDKQDTITEDEKPEDSRTHLVDHSPCIKKMKSMRATPTYHFQLIKEDQIRSIEEHQVFGSGKNHFLTCRFNYDDDYIAAGAADGFVHVFHLESGDTNEILVENIGTAVTAVRWIPQINKKRILICVCADGNIVHFNTDKGKLLNRHTEEDNQILCLDINPAGTHYATAGKDRTIRIYDEETQKLSLKLNPSSYGSLGHNNRIFAVKFNPEDPNVLLSGSWDGCIGFWDLRDKSAYGMVQGTEISGDALDIKNNRILTGSYRKENQLELWDYINRKKLRNIYWENDHNPKNALIYGCQFSKKDDKTILAGCCGLDQVRCFDPDNGYKYFGTSGDYKHKIYSVDFANNKDLFAYCGSDGYVHTVKLLSEVLN